MEQDLLQTSALLLLTLSHLILQWRCQEYRSSNHTFTKWIHSKTDDFSEGMDEIGAILEDIAGGFQPAQQESPNQTTGAMLPDLLSGLLMSKLNQTVEHGSKENEVGSIFEEDDPPEIPE